MDISIPEVQAANQIARFYKDGDRDMVEIQNVGQKDTYIKRVTPDVMAKFRDEWNAYCDGVPLKKREGTPLTDVNGMTDKVAENYISQNVHTAEELAALSDAQCQGLGHGTLTLRASAKTLLEMRKMKLAEEVARKISKTAESVLPMPAEELDAKYASKQDVDEIKNMLAQLLTAQTPRKPGRPKKEE